MQFEPRLDARDLQGSGDERMTLPSAHHSGSDDSDVQTVPFEPHLRLPDTHLQVRACLPYAVRSSRSWSVCLR